MAKRGETINSSASTTISLAKPAGTVDDDVAYMWLVADSTTMTATWPTGFTELSISPLITSVLDAQTFRVARKVCSGEPATWTGSATTNVKQGVVVLSGRDTASPEHRSSGVTDTTSRSSPWTATSGAFSSNTALVGCDILFFQADDVNTSANSVAHTPPTDFTLVGEFVGASFIQSGLSIKENAGSGETGVYAGVGTAASGNTNLAIAAIAAGPAGVQNALAWVTG